MTLSLALLAALTAPAWSASLFNPSTRLVVRPEWKNSVPALALATSLRAELESTYEARNPGSSEPSFSNRTNQRVSWRRLPAEKGVDRFELVFEEYLAQTRVSVLPGAAPINTRLDFGTYLAGKIFRMSGKGGQPEKVENMDAIRGQLSSEVKDPIARQALLMTVKESTVLDGARAYLPENGCLRDLAGKKVGQSWKMEPSSQGMKMGFECKFSGWAEAGSERVAVVEVKIPRARQETQLPMGGKTQVETEGTGLFYYEPKSREGVLLLDMDIGQPSTPGEKGGSETKSMLHTYTHTTAI